MSNLTEVSLNNQPYLKGINIGSALPGEDPKDSFTIDVYFSKQSNGYPMKWDEKSKTGKINMTYDVQELGYIALKSGGNLPYPKRAIIENYNRGKLTETDEVEIKDIRFGTVSDDDIFIDPASARRIRDLYHLSTHTGRTGWFFSRVAALSKRVVIARIAPRFAALPDTKSPAPFLPG